MVLTKLPSKEISSEEFKACLLNRGVPCESVELWQRMDKGDMCAKIGLSTRVTTQIVNRCRVDGALVHPGRTVEFARAVHTTIDQGVKHLLASADCHKQEHDSLIVLPLLVWEDHASAITVIRASLIDKEKLLFSSGTSGIAYVTEYVGREEALPEHYQKSADELEKLSEKTFELNGIKAKVRFTFFASIANFHAPILGCR